MQIYLSLGMIFISLLGGGGGGGVGGYARANFEIYM